MCYEKVVFDLVAGLTSWCSGSEFVYRAVRPCAQIGVLTSRTTEYKVLIASQVFEHQTAIPFYTTFPRQYLNPKAQNITMATLPIPGSDLALLAVSSDLINTSGRIVYRHDPSMRPLDLKFNLGEIEVVGVRWGFPSVIDMEPGFIYNNVAIAHDLTKTAQGVCVIMIPIKQDWWDSLT